MTEKQPGEENEQGKGMADYRLRRERWIPNCIASLHDLVLRSGTGSIVEDVAGFNYVDLTSGLGVLILGYAHPEVTAELQEQAARLAHASFPTFPSEPYLECAERLSQLAEEEDAGGSRYKTCFFNSGAEAIDNAVKIARWNTGRQEFMAVGGGFHGRTWAALALTAKEAPYKAGLGPPPFEVHRLPLSLATAQLQPDRANRLEEASVATLDAALEAFASGRLAPDRVAGLFLEPVLGEGGVQTMSPAFLMAARRFCSRHGILLIADEIQCGLGRTGSWFVSTGAGAQPDIIVAGKAIGGGLPLSALIGRAEIMDALHRGALGGTMGGNPVACAAGCRVLDVLRREKLPRRAGLIANAARRVFVGLDGAVFNGTRLELRLAGAMIGLAFAGSGNEPEQVLETLRRGRGRGVLALRGGERGEVLRLLPALNIPEPELEHALKILAGCVVEVLEKQGG